VYGLSRSAGRIYGTLYFATEPLSIPELVEETGYAKSTISNVTRKLTRVGLVRRRSSSGGGRRVRFDPETDIWFVVQDVVQQYVRRETSVTGRTLDRALDRLEPLDGEDAEADRERVRRLQATYDELRTFLELATEHSTEELIEAIEEYEE
jgi:DNA-binding transcriptional regulator GbsR (MarR family)